MNPAAPSDDPIVITAMSAVSPIGCGLPAFEAALFAGASGIKPEPDGAPLRLASRIGEFGAREHIPANSLRRMPRATQLALVAVKHALADAGGELPYDSTRIGVVIGTGMGTLDETIGFQRGYLTGGPEAASPMLFPVSVMNAAAGQIAVECKLRGVNSTINHRDASPTQALGMAADMLRFGRADALLVGAVDELSPIASEAYALLAERGLGNEGAFPYDRRRAGLVPGEIATVLLLERLGDARARGRRPLAIVGGYGETGDQRSRLGWGPVTAKAWPNAHRAVDKARGGNTKPIDWIVGSGNGTSLDESELLVYRQSFGDVLPPISSPLAQLGESMSSSLARVIIGVLGIERQTRLGTFGCRDPIDPAIVLTTAPANTPLRSVLIPTFAQGGANVVVRLDKPE